MKKGPKMFNQKILSQLKVPPNSIFLFNDKNGIRFLLPERDGVLNFSVFDLNFMPEGTSLWENLISQIGAYGWKIEEDRLRRDISLLIQDIKSHGNEKIAKITVAREQQKLWKSLLTEPEKDGIVAKDTEKAKPEFGE